MGDVQVCDDAHPPTIVYSHALLSSVSISSPSSPPRTPPAHPPTAAGSFVNTAKCPIGQSSVQSSVSVHGGEPLSVTSVVSPTPRFPLGVGDRVVVNLMLHQMQQLLRVFNSTVHVAPCELQEFMELVFRTASQTFSIHAAQQWGSGFQFTQQRLDRDLADFRAHGSSLSEFCRFRQNALRSVRLSPQRVFDVFGLDGTKVPGVTPLDFRNLLEFAQNGVSILIPEGFQPCSEPPPLRQKYQDVATAVNKLFDKQHKKGQLLILPVDVARAIPGVHFSPQHWTEKKGKPQGRAIGDLSNADVPGSTPLNGDGNDDKDILRSRIEQAWSTIHHPTLPELMRMVLRVTDEHGWEGVSLWKKDLQGAFNLLWFHPDSVRLLAFLLTGGLVVFHLVGLFGWTGMPHAFAVVTRCVLALVRAAVQGEADMYVDDIMGVTPTASLSHDMTVTDTFVTALLGPEAVAVDKDEQGRRLEWIGWDVDLNTKCVTLSKRNLLKTLYVFTSFDINDNLSKSHVEAMASLASRCSMLVRQMRPFTRALHLCAAQFGLSLPGRQHCKKRLTPEAKVDVAYWRSFYAACHFDEVRFARTIESFRQIQPLYLLEYDSSLEAFAVGISSYDPVSNTASLLAATSLLSPFAPTIESKKQNTYEYLAVLIGVLMAKRLGLRNFTYRLFGDSMSSLSWAANDRASSSLARRANIGLTLVSVDINASVAETIHVPGLKNVVYDGLSRGKSMREVGLDPSKQLVFNESHVLHQYVAMCDPDLPLDTYHDHIELSSTLSALLASPLF